MHADELNVSLVTVRDWLRYAVSRFREARLSYGHGTSTDLDEAAFLILEALHLPIDTLEPWLDAVLLHEERTRVGSLIEARVSTRKPAAYLLGAAYVRGHRFVTDDRVIVPRSYIAELLADEIEGGGAVSAVTGSGNVERVLDLCTGGGSIAVLAALAFPEAHVTATDLSADALVVAVRNVADYGLESRVSLAPSDLFAALGGQQFDLILSNPPYVTDAAMRAFPPEHRAEPALAHSGGADGLDVVRKILASAGSYLTTTGTLIVEVGCGRSLLEAAYPDLPFIWLDSEQSRGEVFALAGIALAEREATRSGRQRKPR